MRLREYYDEPEPETPRILLTVSPFVEVRELVHRQYASNFSAARRANLLVREITHTIRRQEDLDLVSEVLPDPEYIAPNLFTELMERTEVYADDYRRHAALERYKEWLWKQHMGVAVYAYYVVRWSPNDKQAIHLAITFLSDSDPVRAGILASHLVHNVLYRISCTSSEDEMRGYIHHIVGMFPAALRGTPVAEALYSLAEPHFASTWFMSYQLGVGRGASSTSRAVEVLPGEEV